MKKYLYISGLCFTSLQEKIMCIFFFVKQVIFMIKRYNTEFVSQGNSLEIDTAFCVAEPLEATFYSRKIKLSES